MSEWTKIRDDIEAPIEAAITWVEGTKLGQTLVAGYKAALAELSVLAPADLEAAVEKIGVAALGGLASGGEAGAIAAGIAAAPAAFKAAEKDITQTTTATLVGSIVTGLKTQAATGTAPAAPPAAS
jgi:hypothetical protein